VKIEFNDNNKQRFNEFLDEALSRKQWTQPFKTGTEPIVPM
jgi:ESCRT-II complex subunit VPS36